MKGWQCVPLLSMLILRGPLNGICSNLIALAEAEKNTPIVQNITYNIQDSAISGDITNKITRNDLE